MSDLLRRKLRMLAELEPELQPGEFVFCTTSDPAVAATCAHHARAMFVEREGQTFVLPISVAAAHGFDCSLPMRQITLQISSELDAVGLTAAVSAELEMHQIPCNMIAAFHHDHVFVPSQLADDARRALAMLQSKWRAEFKTERGDT